MASIRQVLLYSILMVSVYGHHHETRRLLHFLNPMNVLETAAKITYPITSGFNNAVGNFLDSRNQLHTNYPPNPYEKYPSYGPESRNGIVREIIDAVRKIIRENGRDNNSPYSSESFSDEFYDSRSDWDHSENRYGFDLPVLTPPSLESDSIEANDPVSDINSFYKKPNLQSAPITITENIPPDTNDAGTVEQDNKANSPTVPREVTDPNQIYFPIDANSENHVNANAPNYFYTKDTQQNLSYAIHSPGNGNPGTPNITGFYFESIYTGDGTPTLNSSKKSVTALNICDSAKFSIINPGVDNSISVADPPSVITPVTFLSSSKEEMDQEKPVNK